MRIGIDIDNVVAEFEAAFRAWINRHTGLALRRSDITRYRFADCCGLSQEEVAKLFAGFVEAGHLRRLSLIPHARAALRALAQQAEVCLVTSRPPRHPIVATPSTGWSARGCPTLSCSGPSASGSWPTASPCSSRTTWSRRQGWLSGG